MDDNFKQLISSSRSLTMILPINPRLDWVAAALGLADSLEKSGKSTTVVCTSPMTVEFSRLVGVDKVTEQLEGKNIVVDLNGYDTAGVDTVTYNIDEQNRFELVIAIKSGYQPPELNQVKVNYTGVNADAVLLVAARDRQQLGKFDRKEITDEAKLAFLGNAVPGNTLQFAAAWGDPNTASISQMAVKIITDLALPFDEDIASNLLYGIEAATNNFVSSATSADSFEAAAACLRHGAIRHFQEVRATQNGGPGRWQPRQRRPWQGPLPAGVSAQPREEQSPVPPQPQVQPHISQPRPSQPVTQPRPTIQPTQSGQAPRQPQPPPSLSPQPQPQPPSPPPQPPGQQPPLGEGQEPQEPSPEWLEPKIYTGRTVV